MRDVINLDAPVVLIFQIRCREDTIRITYLDEWQGGLLPARIFQSSINLIGFGEGDLGC